MAVLSCAEEEKKAVEDSKVEETKAEESGDKKQEKRGIHDFGDWSSSSHHHHHQPHEEKTLTIVKKVPVPVPHYKTVHVPHVKEVHVPVHVKVPKPYPVIKHVSEEKSFLCGNDLHNYHSFHRFHMKSRKS